MLGNGWPRTDRLTGQRTRLGRSKKSFAEKQKAAIKNIRGIDKDYFLAKVRDDLQAVVGNRLRKENAVLRQERDIL